MSTALIIVDVQNDFLPGGALAVPDGFDVIDPLIEFSKNVDYVALTADWHPANHFSFSENPQFVDKSWPPHCVQGTTGAEIHTKIDAEFDYAPLFLKGEKQNVEAYSGFDGRNDDGDSLVDWLQDRDVESVFVGGLALDYCVKATALDALSYFPWDTCVLIDGTRPVSYVTGAEAVAELAAEGAVIGTSERLTSLL